MTRVAISVTTFKKSSALRGSLEGYRTLASNPEMIECIIIGDDNNFETQPIAEEFQSLYEKGEYPFPIKYASGPRGGVAKNKNRTLKVFLEDCTADYLIMFDDDLKHKICEYRYRETHFVDYLLKAHEHTKHDHIIGYISWGYKDPLTGASFLETFPPIAEDEYCYYCQGAQGIMLSMTRELITKIGFMDKTPFAYGYEHILYSARANRVSGRCPHLFPVLKNCSSYFSCADIPNGYDIPKKELESNTKYYGNRMPEIIAGRDLTVKEFWD